MEFGALPAVDDYEVKWPDLNTPSDDEKAAVAEKKTNALSKYVSTRMDALIPPFHYLTMVLGFSDDEANGIIDEAGDRLDELKPDDDLTTVDPNADEDAGALEGRNRQ